MRSDTFSDRSVQPLSLVQDVVSSRKGGESSVLVCYPGGHVTDVIGHVTGAMLPACCCSERTNPLIKTSQDDRLPAGRLVMIS